MDAPSPNPELIESLRARIAQVTAPPRSAETLPFGLDEIDGRLGNRDVCASALHEIAAAEASLADDAAATLFLAGIAARFAGEDATELWAVTRFDLYGPGLEQAGLAPANALFVEACEDKDVLAVMEEALCQGCRAAVVGEVNRAEMTARRCLQLSALVPPPPLPTGRDQSARGSVDLSCWMHGLG